MKSNGDYMDWRAPLYSAVCHVRVHTYMYAKKKEEKTGKISVQFEQISIPGDGLISI